MAITDPRDISGLRLWLSADAISGYSDNTQITTAWSDLSGNGFDGTPTATTTKPKYRTTAGSAGGPAVQFPADGYFTFGDIMASASAGEMMMTVKHDTGDVGAWAFGVSSGNSDESHYPYAGTVYEAFGLASGNRQSFSPSMSIESWRRYNVWSAASDWAARLDETSQFTSAVTSVGWTTSPTIGAGQKNGSVDMKFSGWIGCVVVYNRKLTTGERSDLATWLAANPSGGTVGGTALTQSATDATGLTDSYSTLLGSSYTQTNTDGAGLTDSSSTSTGGSFTQSVTDGTGLTDTSSRVSAAALVRTDTAGLTDAVGSFGVSAVVTGATATISVTAYADEVESYVVDRTDDVVTLTLTDNVAETQPGVLRGTVGNLDPEAVGGTMLYFFFDSDSTAFYTTTSPEGMASISVDLPVDGLTAGAHQVGVSTSTTPPTVFEDFTALVDATTTGDDPVDAPVAPTPPVTNRWVFMDTASNSFTLENNPETYELSFGEGLIEAEPLIAAEADLVMWEGHPHPQTLNFSGRALSQTSYEEMARWGRALQRFFIFDHFNRRMLVKVTDFRINLVRNNNFPWMHQYSFSADVLAPVVQL